MAIQIYQIVFPKASVAPQRFIRQLAAPLTVAAAGTIDLNSLTEPFSDDAGNSPVTVPTVSPNGYYNLYVDGVMQEGGAYQVNAAPTNTITLNVGATFTASTILVLEAAVITTA